MYAPMFIAFTVHGEAQYGVSQGLGLGASPWGGPSWGGTPQDGVYTWDPHMGIPYNARARNVRACPRARARGMNLRVKAEWLF